MLISKLLSTKPFFLKKSGDNIVDLVKRTYNRKLVGLGDVQTLTVDEEEEMRPDLISKRAYLNIFLWDAILKFNGISNPFSIEKGRQFFIPSQNELEKGFKASPDMIDKGIKSNIHPILNAKTQTDKNRLDALAIKPLPNNVVDTTDENVKVKDGKVIFGEDVTKINKERCSGSVSRAKLKEKILQNQIFQ